MVFFHPHERGIRICFGAAVALPALVYPVSVFLDLRQMLLQLFDVPLKLRLPFSGSVDEPDPFFLFDRIESFAQLLQMLQLDLSLPDRAQPVADLTFMEKRCDLFEPL